MGWMPFPFEKGLFTLAIEQYFNEGLEDAPTGGSPAAVVAASIGARRRLRAIWRYCDIATQLRNARSNEAAIREVTPTNSFIYSSIFSLPRFQQLTFLQDQIAQRWFGMKWDTKLNPPKGAYARPATTDWKQDLALGQWTGYWGNVELIVCETLQRMLEASLGLPHQTKVPVSKAEEGPVEGAMRQAVTRVWPVYLFLTCPHPWCTGWVTWQCHDSLSPLRGQVTTILATPGHDRPITPSPVDRAGDERYVVSEKGVRLPNPYFLYGVQNLGDGSNTGYDGKWIDGNGQLHGNDPTTAVVSDRVDQGMWLVTHENHDSTIAWSSFAEPRYDNPPDWDPAHPDQLEAWDLPTIAYYRCAPLSERPDTTSPPIKGAGLGGYFDVVVISLASRDGGVATLPPTTI